MREFIERRAGAIRDYLRTAQPRLGLGLAFRYSVVRAEWEAVRLLVDRANASRAEDRRFAELSDTLRMLSTKMGLDAA
jgi:hypothetical protein